MEEEVVVVQWEEAEGLCTDLLVLSYSACLLSKYVLTLIFLVCYSLWYLEAEGLLGEEDSEVAVVEEALVAEVEDEDDSDVVMEAL